jgi:very-short-patch-repair endonuclease
MAVSVRTVEARMGEIADGAYGVVTRKELLAVGITRTQIEHRLRTGALLREHPGVYRVGHRAPSTEARYLAAVKACGDGAVLGGLAAAYLLGLVRGAPPEPEVIAPREKGIKGVRTRRCRSFDPRDRISWRSIPVTSVARTLVDLAAVLSPEALGLACHEAGIRHKTTPADVEEVLARRSTSPGAAKLRRILRGEERITLSKLEARFLELLREGGLPLPVTNRPAGGRRVDCRWPEQKLTVELDSYTYHSSRHAWEADRQRERAAYARGDDFRRFTRDDVFVRPHRTLRELSPLLPQAS